MHLTFDAESSLPDITNAPPIKRCGTALTVSVDLAVFSGSEPLDGVVTLHGSGTPVMILPEKAQPLTLGKCRHRRENNPPSCISGLKVRAYADGKLITSLGQRQNIGEELSEKSSSPNHNVRAQITMIPVAPV